MRGSAGSLRCSSGSGWRTLRVPSAAVTTNERCKETARGAPTAAARSEKAAGHAAARVERGRDVALQCGELAGRDARVVAHEPGLVGHDAQPEVAVLEARLEANGQQDAEVDGHCVPPTTSESPRISTRTGWASMATAQSWPVAADVWTSLRKRYPAGGSSNTSQLPASAVSSTDGKP